MQTSSQLVSTASLTTTDIRNRIRHIRRTLPKQQREQEQQSVYQQIIHHAKVKTAKNIAIFVAFDGEIDTQPIIEHLWQNNKAVFLPIIHPFNPNYLLFLRYRRESQLLHNKFGILQPKLNVNDVIPFHQLNIVFTPLVAFDDRNYRIGMGGGYYDRMLANYQQYPIYPIGLAFSCQKVDRINNQSWDIKLPEIITGR